MKSKYIGLFVLFLLMSVNIGISGYCYTKLPARVASEFDLSGEPKAWVAKGTFVIFNITLLTLLPVFLLFLACVCPKLPKWMIDLPNWDYWLAPERKAETAASLFRFILWLANGLELFLTVIVGVVYWANLGRPEMMRLVPNIILEGFLPFVVVWMVCYYKKFKKIPASNLDSPPAPLPKSEGE
jgi:uncharacterized membrane protein